MPATETTPAPAGLSTADELAELHRSVVAEMDCAVDYAIDYCAEHGSEDLALVKAYVDVLRAARASEIACFDNGETRGLFARALFLRPGDALETCELIKLTDDHIDLHSALEDFAALQAPPNDRERIEQHLAEYQKYADHQIHDDMTRYYYMSVIGLPTLNAECRLQN